MSTIFDSVFTSRKGLGDINVAVDPFTGKANVYMPAITRYPNGPLLQMGDFFDSVQKQMVAGELKPKIDNRLDVVKDLHNPGLARYKDKYVMIVRYQNNTRFNDHYLAFSDDGITWKHHPVSLDLPGLPAHPKADKRREAYPEIPENQKWHKGIFYDPRVTQMGKDYYITFAIDYDTKEPAGKPYLNVCDNVLYHTCDFKKFKYVSTFGGNTRNGIMFPRKIDGYYYIAARPNSNNICADFEVTGHDSVLFRSRDLIDWEPVHVLFRGGHEWIGHAGPGFPPFEMKDYWVMGVHGVEIHGTFGVHYRGGVALLDKKTLKMVHGPVPILDPQEIYELTGLVHNVCFPTGLLFSDGGGDGIKSRDTKIALYYGGSDHVIHVALSTAGRLADVAMGKYNPFRNC